MPIRLVDGDAIAESDKLARLALTGRADCVSHYEKLLCLAMANGTFEVNPEAIARRLGKILPWMTAPQWNSILVAYEREKLLFTWHDAATGKRWGYWIGVERRLPPQSDVVRHKWPVGARVPVADLARFQGRPVEDVEAALAETAAVLGQAEVVQARRGRARAARTGRACPTRGAVGGRKGLGEEEVEVVEGARDGFASPVPALRSPTAHAATGTGEEARQGDPRKKRAAGFSGKTNGNSAPANGNGQAQGASGSVACDYLRFEREFRRLTGGHAGGRDRCRREAYLVLVREAGSESAVFAALKSWARKRGGPERFRTQRHDLAALDFLEGEGLVEVRAAAESARASRKPDPNCPHCKGTGAVLSGHGAETRARSCSCAQG